MQKDERVVLIKRAKQDREKSYQQKLHKQFCKPADMSPNIIYVTTKHISKCSYRIFYIHPFENWCGTIQISDWMEIKPYFYVYKLNSKKQMMQLIGSKPFVVCLDTFVFWSVDLLCYCYHVKKEPIAVSFNQDFEYKRFKIKRLKKEKTNCSQNSLHNKEFLLNKRISFAVV